MAHIEEEKVTTTYEEVDPATPKVENINLNVNTDNDGETVTVDESAVETTEETPPQQVNINAPR
jgi:hypothetical protein